MMLKYKTASAAKESAQERGLLYGYSVFGGLWYVGTKSELLAIGVWSIQC